MDRMDETFLYRRIAETIRQDILTGQLQPGDRLPTIRELTEHWGCTPGTVQRAYQALVQQGLIVSQVGRGTHVAGQPDLEQFKPRTPLRRAALVHRAESFLLESLNAGYELDEIEQALELAADRWRATAQPAPELPRDHIIHFSGSHDMAVIWLAGHLSELCPGLSLSLNFTGSLGGLMALAEGKSILAGCHLLDEETGTYNQPFIRKIFPGKKMLLIHFAIRRIGLIVAPGNPKGVRQVADLLRPDVSFVNRQAGSGTRVWLDATLHRQNIDPAQIEGYENEKLTHSEIARAVAEEQVDAGLGLQSAASAFALDFIPQVEECYDLVTFADWAEHEPLSKLLNCLSTPGLSSRMVQLPGYDFSHLGERLVLG